MEHHLALLHPQLDQCMYHTLTDQGFLPDVNSIGKLKGLQVNVEDYT